MLEIRAARFINKDIDEKGIDTNVLPVVKALRAKGIETWASCSGICDTELHEGWGAYVQVYLPEQKDVEEVVRLADSVTLLLQEKLNPQVQFQMVSAEAWYSDPNSCSRTCSPCRPIFRLQLAGLSEKKDYVAAWQIVTNSI